MVKTKMKDLRKLTVEMWSQKLGKIASLGFRGCERSWQIADFGTFKLYFLQSNLRPNTATFLTIRDHISKISSF